MNWPIWNSTQNRNSIKIKDNTITWNPSLFFISNTFYRTQNKFSPLNDHTSNELAWVVTMVTGHAQYCYLMVACHVKVATVAGYLPCQVTQNQFPGLCNINEWWKRQRPHTVARFGCNCVCHVTNLPISPQGRTRYELSYRANLQQNSIHRKLIK